MKKKPISVIITLAILLSTIGGAIGYNTYIYEWETDHGACHGSVSGSHPYGGPTLPSQNGTIIIDPVTDPATITVGMRFTISMVLRNFTEVYEAAHDAYDPLKEGRDNKTNIGISSMLGDNAEFMLDTHDPIMMHGVTVNATGDADVTGGYGSHDLELTLRAPFAGGKYELVVAAIAGMNHSDGRHAANFTYALGSIWLTIYTKAPAGVISTSGDDDDDDDDAEGAISGYILIITIATIFSISAVLILRMKKLMKNKSRNV